MFLAALVVAVAIALAAPAASSAAEVRLDPRHMQGGDVAPRFVGLSVEWSLIERYMGPDARPAFVRLLRNLGGGVLRIGGSSQDLMPFDAAVPNTDEVITPEDLRFIRDTIDAANEGRPSWGVSLGTAMAPAGPSRPFVSPEHARAFVTQGVRPAFAGAEDELAGVALGNEPDLTYGSDDLEQYLADLGAFAEATAPLPIVAPDTSEDILPWETIAAGPTRFFWDWPRILDAIAPEMRARAGAFAPYATDHFYPLARTCTNRPYRCPSTGALLSTEHIASLDYQVYHHARDAAEHGLGFRLDETNTAAGRGADGVSNVAASAAYALDMMFHSACPRPGDAPSANAACDTGAVGVNLHNAEVRAFFEPEEGNAYYNAVDYDPTPAMGAPRAAPPYYALLLFGRLAQGASGLRPVEVPGEPQVSAWRLQGRASERRLFLVNKQDRPAAVDVTAPAEEAWIDRMTPYDPTGAGRTLDASEVRIDGREVAADGAWPGLRPERADGRRIHLDLAAGEAAVVSVHTHEEGR